VSALIDTSVLIDFLRGITAAGEALEQARKEGPLRASEITRLEVLSGMQLAEEHETRLLLSTLVWHPVDAEIAEEASALGRRWLPGHRAIDSADLAIAATAIRTDSRLMTLNVKHFPMFTGLKAPY
jgi:predicted nucleic acid-binding protein